MKMRGWTCFALVLIWVCAYSAGCSGDDDAEEPSKITIADVDLKAVADCIREFVKAHRAELPPELNAESVNGEPDVREKENIAVIGDWMVKGGAQAEGLRVKWRGFGVEVELILDRRGDKYETSNEYSIVNVGD